MSGRYEEKNIFIDQKLVMKLRTYEDGELALRKHMPIKAIHVFRMTGSPGWDRHTIDTTFTRGKVGSLEYRSQGIIYRIPIESFREHAFLKDLGYGEQYHCSIQWYEREDRRVDPLREGSENKPEAPAIPVMPARLVLGEHRLCQRCSGRGNEPGNKKVVCTKCLGLGIQPNTL